MCPHISRPVIQSLPPQRMFSGSEIIDPTHAGSRPDDLFTGTESTCRLFNRLSDLAEGGADEGDDVVEGAGWKHSALSLTSFLRSAPTQPTYDSCPHGTASPSHRHKHVLNTLPNLPYTHSRTWAPMLRFNPGTSAGARIVLRPLFHHARSESSIPKLTHLNDAVRCTLWCSLSHLTAYPVPGTAGPATDHFEARRFPLPTGPAPNAYEAPADKGQWWNQYDAANTQLAIRSVFALATSMHHLNGACSASLLCLQLLRVFPRHLFVSFK
ncbi:hypothetical protein EDB85DRAFT_1889976 [Lactarius pseudohatsudake]|nr:hypothetical protein EDB85DRAFT_1889976 [Lactarius pseudohatsudake]